MKSKLQLVLTIIAILSWVIMFLAGSDIWNDAGRKDIWALQGVPYNDLRVLLYCFYGLFILLITNLGLDIMAVCRKNKS